MTDSADALSPAEKQLAEVRARRSAARAVRELAAREREAQSELDRELLAEKDDEAIAAAVEEHGDLDSMIGAVYTVCGVVIVKRPKAATFRKFQDNPKVSTSIDYEKLVRPCLVYPDQAEFDRYCAEQPATLMRVADKVTTLAGFRVSDVAGK